MHFSNKLIVFLLLSYNSSLSLLRHTCTATLDFDQRRYLWIFRISLCGGNVHMTPYNADYVVHLVLQPCKIWFI